MKIQQCINQASFKAQLNIDDGEGLFKPNQVKKLSKIAAKIGNSIDVVTVSVGVPYKCSVYGGQFLGTKYDIVLNILMEGKEYTKNLMQSIKPNQKRKPVPIIAKFLRSLQVK